MSGSATGHESLSKLTSCDKRIEEKGMPVTGRMMGAGLAKRGVESKMSPFFESM